MQVLENNQGYAQQVAKAGFDLVHAVLKPNNVLEYWYRLLLAYAELQTFTPSVHPDAMTLASSILGNAQELERPFEERTCNICRHVTGERGLYSSGYYRAIHLADEPQPTQPPQQRFSR